MNDNVLSNEELEEIKRKAIEEYLKNSPLLQRKIEEARKEGYSYGHLVGYLTAYTLDTPS